MTEAQVFMLTEKYFDWLKRLDELEIPYQEHYHGSGFSSIVVTLETEAQRTALLTLLSDLVSFINLQKLESEKAQKKLDRKNRWRKITFRDPILYCPGSQI